MRGKVAKQIRKQVQHVAAPTTYLVAKSQVKSQVKSLDSSELNINGIPKKQLSLVTMPIILGDCQKKAAKLLKRAFMQSGSLVLA